MAELNDFLRGAGVQLPPYHHDRRRDGERIMPLVVKDLSHKHYGRYAAVVRGA
jgi:hypothetical protein